MSANIVSAVEEWQQYRPGPDTLLFHEDGSITNRRAGLIGPWRIAGDTTLVIGSPVFHHRADIGDLFSAFNLDAPEAKAPGWRIRRGSDQ